MTHTTVLHLDPAASHQDAILYTQAPDEDEDYPTLILPTPQWEDLRQPETITITIHPRDTLNDDGPDCE